MLLESGLVAGTRGRVGFPAQCRRDDGIDHTGRVWMGGWTGSISWVGGLAGRGGGAGLPVAAGGFVALGLELPGVSSGHLAGSLS